MICRLWTQHASGMSIDMAQKASNKEVSEKTWARVKPVANNPLLDDSVFHLGPGF